MAKSETKQATVEVWIAIGQDGDYQVRSDRDEAIEAYTDNIGLNGPIALHKLLVSVPCPRVRETVAAIPESKEGELVVMDGLIVV